MKRGFKTIRPIGGARDPRHGTIGGYAYWGCRCIKCLDANREVGRQNLARRRADMRPEHHGKVYTYNAGCRCELCVQANRVTNARNRHSAVRRPAVDLGSLA